MYRFDGIIIFFDDVNKLFHRFHFSLFFHFFFYLHPKWQPIMMDGNIMLVRKILLVCNTCTSAWILSVSRGVETEKTFEITDNLNVINVHFFHEWATIFVLFLFFFFSSFFFFRLLNEIYWNCSMFVDWIIILVFQCWCCGVACLVHVVFNETKDWQKRITAYQVTC